LTLTSATIISPFPSPILFACAGFSMSLPFTVAIGSGQPILTVSNGSQPVFQISDGGFGLLRITSFGASLSFSLVATTVFSLGVIIGRGTSQARIPFGTPFRLLVQGGGKVACIQATAFSFFFGAVLTGTASHN
jgi:hypothetical protein